MFPRSGAATVGRFSCVTITARCCFMLIIVLGLAQVWPHAAEAKKLIYYGWNIRDPRYVKNNWQQMEQMPFHGVGLLVPVNYTNWYNGTATDTNNQAGWKVMGSTAYTMAQFSQSIADLQTPQWQQFTNNFLPAILSSHGGGNVNWFDDARWATISNNFGVYAQLAAAIGAKGFIFDPEQYSGIRIFATEDQPERGSHTLAEFKAKAKQRGNQVMQAMLPHLPSPIIISIWSYTGLRLFGNTLELLPSFYDGMLEAMPATGRLVDGYEYGYYYDQLSQFQAGATEIHNARSLSSVPSLYDAKVQVGFGLWPDLENNSSMFYTAAEWRNIVEYALDVADEYVWVYTEHVYYYFSSPPNVPAAILAAQEDAVDAVNGGEEPPPPPTPGLVGHWALDENTGTMAADSSTLGNHGALVNGPVWRGGRLGAAVRFDGNDDLIRVNDSASLDITGDLTVAGWVYPTAQNPSGYIPALVYKRAKQYGCCYQPSYGVGIDVRNRQIYFSLGGASAYQQFILSRTIALNTWLHLAAVRGAVPCACMSTARSRNHGRRMWGRSWPAVIR